MHDCRIAATTELRDDEIKNYADKLCSLEKEFADAEKLNIELDPTNSRQQSEIIQLIVDIETDMIEFN